MMKSAYSNEFKAAVVADYQGGMRAAEVAAKHGIKLSSVYNWRQNALGSRSKGKGKGKKKSGTELVPVNGNGKHKLIPGTRINATSMQNVMTRIKGVYVHLARGERRLISEIRAGRLDSIRGANLDLVNAMDELTAPE